jgi:hypothetical protein
MCLNQAERNATPNYDIMFSEVGMSTLNLKYIGFRYHQISSSFLLALYLEEMETCQGKMKKLKSYKNNEKKSNSALT